MNPPSVIIISGMMGSGKSTLIRMLAEKLGYTTMDGGVINREMAKEKGMSIEAWSEYAKQHVEIDHETDRRLIEAARKGGVVIQSRVLPYLAEIRELPNHLTLYLDTDIKTRARRLAEREGITEEQALSNIDLRDGNNHERFKAVYGIDTRDTSVYDLVVKNSTLSPQETLDLVLDKLKNRSS